MRAPGIILIWGFLTGVAAGRASAAPPSSFVAPVAEKESKNSFTFRVDPPALLLSSFPDGTSGIRLDGFAGRDRRPGAPDLPLLTLRVAIPDGVEPRLEIASILEDRLPHILPRPVARSSASLSPEADAARDGFLAEVTRDERREPDPAIYGGRGVYPESVVRLGAIGVYRDQRYVEVIVSPVRFDPLLRGLRVARSLQVTVAFDGDRGQRTEPRPDPRLEDHYRSLFVNYAQGMTFRLGEGSPSSALLAAPAAPLAGPRYRLKVRADGVVRLDFSKLNGTGFESQPLSTYKLTERGSEIPLLVFDANSNDQLDAGDWVEFYGQALTDEPKTILNTVIPGGTNIYELRDYTDENTYFLTAEPGARSRLATRSAPANLSTPVAKFGAVAHAESDDTFRPLGAADPWYWKPSQSNPSVSGSPTLPLSRTQSIALPGLASTTDPVHVLVRLRGLSEDANTYPDHHSRITLKNSVSSSLKVDNDDGTFDGRTLYTHDFTWTYPGSGAAISDPAQVTIDALSVAGPAGYKNQFILDYIELQYNRTFQASGDTLTFTYPDGDAEFQVTGLATTTPEVWEITGTVDTSANVAPVRLTGLTYGGGSGNFSVRFHMSEDPSIPDGTPRRFIVAGANAVAIPAAADFTADTVSDLRDTSNQADLIVIAHPTVLGATSTATLNSLLAWKSANQGITSKVVMIQDVYDEFADGIPTAQAIKNFLTFVMSTNPGEGWSGRKPAWVLLIGDGSYDPKYNDTTVPVSNFVPTQILFKDDPSFGYYASDSLLMDVVGGDTIPDLTVGRISTRTDAQTNVVLQKLLNYEQNPPTGNWRRHAIVVSDRGKNYNPNEANDWETTNAAGIAFMKIPPHNQRTMRYWTDYCGGVASGCTPAAAEALRSDIKKAVNGTDGQSDGAAIMQYTGHGNFNVWSDDAFFAEGWNGFMDVQALTNGTKLPWLIVHNCLSAGFMDTNDVTLGEDFVKRNGGGAMAVYAPSGLTDAYNGQEITQSLWGDVFGNTKERVLGNAVAQATDMLCASVGGNVVSCQNYVLLGDPTTQMVMPSVGPPSNVAAAAGSGVVNLTWTASSTAGATYNVYRAANTADSTYTQINSGAIAGTAYADTTVQNAKAYFYAVVALDGEGFESRWSNFNSDCAVSGPDCVTATPTNPNPPSAPTGTVVTDPETGAKLNVTWSANSETDIDHYTVWWGTAPGAYTASISAGRMTSYSITGLVNGTPYYVAVTASNTSGHTSAYSAEASGVPTFVRGLRAPEFITTLRVDKSGTDAHLTWGAVTTDIYGKPATITSYEVYRGTTPDFVPAAGNRVATPATTTFTDVGALTPGGSNYYWLVRAVDASGTGGGLGNQLPNGIDILTMSKTPDGLGGYTLGFAWPAVTTDFDGNPLAIDHYEVYGTNHPFSRADVKNGLVPLVGTTSLPSYSVTAPSASQYYSVLAVDARGNKSSF